MSGSIPIGELVIGLRSDVARIKSDMDETKKAVQGAMKDVEGYVNAAKSVLTQFIGIASVGAFVGFVESSIKARAGLVDLATQSGITVEALSALGKVGKYTDTALTDIVAASNKLSKALFTNGEDSKGAAQGLKALGLDYITFKQLKPEEQLLAVAKAMDQFQDGTGKSATAMLLFGKTGATLLPFLRDLAEKNELVGKVTTETALQAKQYERNLRDLDSVGEAWKNKLLTAIIPALTATSQAFLENARTSGVFLGALKTLGDGTLARLGFDEFKPLKDKAAEASAEIARITDVMENLRVIIDRDPSNEKAIRRYENLGGKLRSLQVEAMAATQGLKDLADIAAPAETPKLSKPKLPDTAPDAGGHKHDEFTPLLKRLTEENAATQAQIDSEVELSAARKEAAKIAGEYAAGLLRISPAQLAVVDGLLKQRVAMDDVLKARKLDEQYLKEAGAENVRYVEQQQKYRDTLQQQAKDMQRNLVEYGLSSEAVKDLETARLRDAAAALEQKAAAADNAYLSETADLYRQQANALRDIADARQAIAGKEANERNDPLTGARRGVETYLSDIKRAGDATRGAVENSLHGLEDTSIAVLRGRGGRSAAKAWVDGIINETLRLQIIRPFLQSIFGSLGGGGGGGGGGFLSGLFSLFGGGGGGATTQGGATAGIDFSGIGFPAAQGIDRVPYDGFLARLHKDEEVKPAAYRSENGGGARVTLNVVNKGEPVKATATQRQTDQGMVIDLVLEAVAADVAGGGKVANAMASTYQLNRAGSAPRY